MELIPGHVTLPRVTSWAHYNLVSIINYNVNRTRSNSLTIAVANGDDYNDILNLMNIFDYTIAKTFPIDDANGAGGVDIMDLVWIIDAIVGGDEATNRY